ncbi:sigma-70 family RNA polymerase sigma factor [Bacillus sp. 03113]|uniref:sigma-70 family RNA polymerase sigma factor n=1 Tax=Bacillus sp. 03113 TaxID=2578211 RepID=UPI001141C9B8|nr:sigma-70 family RNA polymerase sigma factor [Bacillus sp. 03113]
MEESVSELLELENEEALLDEMMIRYGQSILELVYSYVHNQSVVEDLTQEIFVKCYKALHTYQRDAKFKTWLWRIAINHCKDYLKSWYHRKVWMTEKMASFTGPATQNVEQDILNKESEEVLAHAVLRLPVKYREVIYLYYFEELSIKEIEAIIDVKINTIKTRLKRAKELLKVELEGC